jgi:trehalose 6-phosphate synthase/phosphatase
LPRLLLVSNRLPVSARVGRTGITVEPSSGGLATGLRGAYARSGGLWIGWPGDIPRLDRERRDELEKKLEQLHAVPVYMNRREVRGFYEEISNGVLWPLMHYLLDSVPPGVGGWHEFRSVNHRFARIAAEHYKPGDTVWIHDYQLALVPSMLRELIPDARIGYFLHIPFPSSEVFSVLPWREEILQGMLGADLIGLHTPSYLRHFTTSLRRILGLEADVDRVVYKGRHVRLGVYPMGVDATAWAARGDQSEVARSVAAIKQEAGDRKILVGIDRLDYTKGIPRRLVAIERLFRQRPSLRGKIRYIQVTVPSRQNVGFYADFRRRIDELVGRINAEFSTPNWVPIHSMYRSLPEHEVSALYRAADVMLVTPLRDGMNLVAKEFVASRTDEDGVLILSEFAGAAWELGEALHVNPYDADRLAERIAFALDMPREERQQRMRALRRRVMSHDVHRWAATFVRDLEGGAVRHVETVPTRIDPIELARRLRDARELVLIVDYDGTLVPFAPTPEQAVPDPEVLDLLRSLAETDGVRLHVVSGRARGSIEQYLGGLPIGLHAEHGLWSRMAPGEQWTLLQPVLPEWKEKVRPLLEHFTSTTRGSFIEEKTASIAWHYRLAKADFTGKDDFADHQAKELRLLLAELLSNAPLEVISGEKVVEVRPQGVNKGAIVGGVLRASPPNSAVVAIGDDRTDEDLFAALPPPAITVHVGSGESRASFCIAGVTQVRQLLRAILDARRRSSPDAEPALAGRE